MMLRNCANKSIKPSAADPLTEIAVDRAVQRKHRTQSTDGTGFLERPESECESVIRL